jgi:hypothetical protein
MKIYKVAQQLDVPRLTNAVNVLQGTIIPAIQVLNGLPKDHTIQQLIADSMDSGNTTEFENIATTAIQSVQQIVSALPSLQNSGIDLTIITEAIRGGDIPSLEQIVKGTISANN